MNKGFAFNTVLGWASTMYQKKKRKKFGYAANPVKDYKHYQLKVRFNSSRSLNEVEPEVFEF